MEETLSEICSPSSLEEAEKESSELLDRWSRVMQKLATASRKLNQDDLKFEEAGKVSPPAKKKSMGQSDSELASEFRSAFRQVSEWIEGAEARLKEDRASQVC